jgi:hypothetical protein
MIDTVLYTTIIVSAAYFLWRFTVEWIEKYIPTGNDRSQSLEPRH